MPNRFSIQTLLAPWNKLTIRRQGYIVVAVPLLCLLGSLGAFSWLRHNIDRAQAWVDHTDQVLIKSNELLIGLLNAETGVRGYVITRRAEFLDPYRQSQQTLTGILAELKQLVTDNPKQMQQVLMIERLGQARLQALSAFINEVNRLDQAALPFRPSLPQIQQGKAQMNIFRAALTQFEREERRFLQNRQQILARQQHLMDLSLWGALGISAVGSIIALTLFSQLERNLWEREQKLRESRTLLQAVVANVVDGVVILNSKGQIEAFNTAAEQMFGYQAIEVMGHPLSMLLAHPMIDDDDPERPPIAAHLRQVGPRWQTLGCRKGKDLFPIELSVSQVDLDTSQRMAIIQDITERQTAEKKLKSRAAELARLNLILASTNAMLKDRNRELDQFAYVTSHDLKAPLRAIANLSEWIEEDLRDQLTGETQTQMQLLRSRVHRMEALINGLLEYSRVGRMHLPTETVDVNALLREVLEMLSPPPTFTIDIAPDLPVLNTRRMLLKQVFSNLIDNAIKYHPRPSGRVTITVQAQGDWYEFAVHDDGQGIDPHYHEKIFVIFQTLQARDAYESTGVGLSIVKKIVEAEGGIIQLESQIGQGTIFRFTWPKTLRGD
jgi:PAS domain S-box-containing protein